jgi:hypothetical protein
VSARLFLAAILALALLAGFTAVFFRRGPVTERRAPPGMPETDAGGPPAARKPGLHAPEGTAVDTAQAAIADAPAPDPLASLQGALPALERAAWTEIGAALAGGGDSRKLPRALQALALELAGTVRTTASTGPGELTEPVVLSRILEEVLARGGEPLTEVQRREIADVVGRAGGEIDRVVAGMEARPRLTSTLDEVELKLGFMEGLAETLAPRQREAFERLVAREGAPLSPLDLIESREIEFADAASFERAIAPELAREFGIDPVLTESLASRLRNDLAPLLDGSAGDLSAGERALVAGRAQARMLEDILRAPGLGPEAREHALGRWVVVVPRPRPD